MTELSKIQAKAVLLGALVDIGGSILAIGIFAFFMIFVLAAQGVPQTEIDAQLLQSSAFLGGSLVIGFVFTFLGGFVAARLAKVRAVMHSSIVGGISFLLGLVFLLIFGPDALPLWYNLIGILLSIPIAALGGYIAKRKVEQPVV